MKISFKAGEVKCLVISLLFVSFSKQDIILYAVIEDPRILVSIRNGSIYCQIRGIIVHLS